MQKCKNAKITIKQIWGRLKKKIKIKQEANIFIYIYKDLQVAISCHQVFLY